MSTTAIGAAGGGGAGGGGDGGGRTPARYTLGPAPAGSGCGHDHPPGAGRLDESARRLSHEEYRVAGLLAAEGHDVRSLAESTTGGRMPDLEVCGSGVEVKSFRSLPERDGRAPSALGVLNKLIDASGQARSVVLVGHGSGLTEATVRRGVARYAADPDRCRLDSVRTVGDGFDLTWVRQPALGHRIGHPGNGQGREAARRQAGPAPGLGL